MLMGNKKNATLPIVTFLAPSLETNTWYLWLNGGQIQHMKSDRIDQV